MELDFGLDDWGILIAWTLEERELPDALVATILVSAGLLGQSRPGSRR
jgi:hypothetical protein